jgi:hypothetical protein
LLLDISLNESIAFSIILISIFAQGLVLKQRLVTKEILEDLRELRRQYLEYVDPVWKLLMEFVLECGGTALPPAPFVPESTARSSGSADSMFESDVESVVQGSADSAD